MITFSHDSRHGNDHGGVNQHDHYHYNHYHDEHDYLQYDHHDECLQVQDHDHDHCHNYPDSHSQNYQNNLGNCHNFAQ